jgi:hypothetical protein
MRRILYFCATLLATTAAFGQSSDDFHKNNLWVGIGPAIPTGNASNYLQAAPLFGFGYDYRFNKYFGADAGFQIAFGAANNQNAVQTDLGPVQGGDHEYMIPLGGRFFIPLPYKRVEVSAGGGAMYLHYSETAPSNGYYSSTCYTCTSRGGWGGYGEVVARYFLDENHNFSVGTILQFISGTTNGQQVGNVPANKTTDHWTNLMFTFGFSF